MVSSSSPCAQGRNGRPGGFAMLNVTDPGDAVPFRIATMHIRTESLTVQGSNSDDTIRLIAVAGCE